MLSKICFYLVLIISTYVIHSTYSQSQKYFRKDYTYIDATQSFYKIHTLQKTWMAAKEMCELEGASLFYPFDKDEADAVIAFWNASSQPIEWMFLGISSLVVDGVFETVDGRSIFDVYDNWAPGEPNNYGGNEKCVVWDRRGRINDDECSKSLAFMCKKTAGSIRWNDLCNIPDPEYQYSETLERCYKFHLTPKSWTDAYATCFTELSRLATINSQGEASHLVELTANAPKDDVEGDFLRGAVHVGFKYDNGWKTIQGVPLKASGYSKWGNGQPDGRDKDEKCGSMFYNGSLNDIKCSTKCFFICEREIPILTKQLTFKFGTQNQTAQ